MRNKLPAGCRENWKFFILHLGTPHEVVKFSVYFTASACVICQCRSSHWSLPLLNISRPFRQFFFVIDYWETWRKQERFCTWSRFKSESFRNSEMAYSHTDLSRQVIGKICKQPKGLISKEVFPVEFYKTSTKRVKTIGWLEMPVRLIR